MMDSEALLIGGIPVSLNCSTVSLTLPTIEERYYFFKFSSQKRHMKT